MHRLVASLLASIAILASAAASAGSPIWEQTFMQPQNGWAQVERWRDGSGGIAAEAYPADGRGDQSGQRATFFGSAQPHSSRFLLYYAPGWNTGSRRVPVLLVHGANQDADLAWADPNEAGNYGCGRQTCPTSGLMQRLSSAGHRVFALGLPHKNGDGYYWSEQIADAIDVIRQRTGATQVDVVAWSKAASNARMYVNGLRRSWGTAYRGDVRRLILLGGANNGIDLSFRHGWTYSLTVYPACGGVINGPTPHTRLVCYGAWRNGSEWAYDSPYFTGSAQLLKSWYPRYGLSTGEQDWYTTFHGGTGYYSEGPGLQAYMKYSLVDSIRNSASPAGVRYHNICGDRPDIALLHNEHTGPSDGVVFMESCRDTQGMTTHGGSQTVPVNHLELGYAPASTDWIASYLAAG